MKFWIVSMECAGIAEAGGVKNVSFSLCKELSLAGHSVTLFIPYFKCTSLELIKDLGKAEDVSLTVPMCAKEESMTFKKAVCTQGDFNVVFVHHPCFEEKEGVYTYTASEQEKNPDFVKGFGHKDTPFMDSLFCKSVSAYGNKATPDEIPDIIHCQDASCSLVPCFASKLQVFEKTAFVVTIHNAGPAYHHNFSSIGEAAWYTGLAEPELSGALNDFKVEPFLLAANAGAHITTVSEHYAKELIDPFNITETEGLSPIFFNRYTNIKGITNGIDYERYDPSNKKESHLPFEFNPEKGDLEGKYKCRDYCVEQLQYTQIEGVKTYGNINVRPQEKENQIFISYHGRITNQKGISVLIKAIPAILNNYEGVKFIIAGQGEIAIEKELAELCNRFSGKVIFLNGYNREAARLVNAIGDFIVLPSFFEPCGLEDFISQIYGTLPIANATGGLNKILNNETGFLYHNNTPENLIAKLSEVIALKLYKPEKIKEMIQKAAIHVHTNYLWRSVINNEYIPFFKSILKK